jgi:hypothetical protein
MLINRGLNEVLADIDSIHNFYEHEVLSRLVKLVNDGTITTELLPDIACVALNHLPPRYIRHDVDMSFYLSPKEYQEIEDKVDSAVDKAVLYVLERDKAD